MAYENKKGNRNKNKRPTNLDYEAPILLDGYAGRSQYDVQEAIKKLIDLNESGVFNILSVPVYMYNADVSGDDQKRGTRVVGFVDRITSAGEDVVNLKAKIFPIYEKALSNITQEAPIFHPVISVNRDGEITRFVRFELATSDRFE